MLGKLCFFDTGKVSVDIPWLSLSSEPVLVHVEDVLILAGPVTDEPYDAEKERLLARARKSRRLELMEEPFADNDLGGWLSYSNWGGRNKLLSPIFERTENLGFCRGGSQFFLSRGTPHLL